MSISLHGILVFVFNSFPPRQRHIPPWLASTAVPVAIVNSSHPRRSLLAGQHDNQKERAPPAQPTPVTFPSLSPPKPSSQEPPPTWNGGPFAGIRAHFLNLKKPSDVSLETLALLNVSFQPQCDFETLLSSVSNDAQSHLPPRSWLELSDRSEPPSSEPIVKLLCNGRRVPDRNEFYVRAKELSFKNEHAFSNLTRKANGSQVPLRLAHFRKFWEGLDNLAYYWDTSLDEYLPPKPANADKDSNGDTLQDSSQDVLENVDQSTTAGFKVENKNEKEDPTIPQPHIEVSEEEPRKKAKTEVSSDETVPQPDSTVRSNNPSKAAPFFPISSSRALPARAAPPRLSSAPRAEPLAEKPIDLSNGSYKGYRIGNGAEMPDQYRLDCVRAFLEPIAWAFGVTLVPHRRPPVLLLEQMRFPVRMSTVAWRAPQDRTKARQGWMEGPVMGVQCRSDTHFGSTGDMQAESILDAARELGGMLLLAQERARQGKTESRGGEGKWWTTARRWGGGPGGEVGEAAGTTETASEEVVPKLEDKAIGRSQLGSRDRRRRTPAEAWKIIKPGLPLWDPKVMYEAIGRDRSVEWDDIFMVSSLNHHVSVLKLRVHPLYIQYLTEGTLPKDAPSDPSWCSPLLHRTRWFDLFDIEDRTEAMRGIWGITAYLMRQQEKHDVSMKDA
ncbi:hypothetical protein K458DRAFT_401271 [Lentithecium fluviatile CBS 122367]|uniref:Uncharacterized protein n=1 Tax=Lentithecium fluviatile CBS 122367 TaxID=1168545 RepID=A0A6G1JB93_9PLEO|nr:hypothetical protein K458DRAFT_401271 [Lentithecium fluviatile CBS 122367]